MRDSKTSGIILIVDDNPTNLAVLLEALTNAGFEVAVAIDGESAINQVNYERPDLILLDVLMPGINGFETCKRLKQNYLTSDIPIIFMTSLANSEERVKGLTIGAVDYITKPFQYEEVLARVNIHLKLHGLTKELAQQNLLLQAEINDRLLVEEALQKLNEELETRVQERTAQLSEAVLEMGELFQQLRDNESRLTQFLEGMPVAVGILDRHGNPYYTNRVAQELLGKGAISDTESDAIPEVYQIYQAGTNELYPSENLPIVRALQGESIRADDLEIHKGDQIIPIEAWGTPIYDANQNVAYAMVAFQDISERQEGEAERQKFMAELFETNIELQLAIESETKLADAASRFVPSQFLSFLGSESIVDVKLGDAVQQEMSVLFADIRDFTALSEQMKPDENFKFINSYLSRMEPLIVANHGFIDKYIGDAIMALFGDCADDAVKAGIALLNNLVEYNTHRHNSGYTAIAIGIGINTGNLMLGTVGGQNRMDSTVIGDAVNLAARVESLTKNYGVSLLITQQTYHKLENPSNYAIRTIDTVQVKGKSELVTVYEVFDADLPEIKHTKLATKSLFEEGLILYHQGNLTEAGILFDQCIKFAEDHYGQECHCDRVAQIYWERCQN